MSLREAFASNLVRLCRREQSVSAVCRSTKINRQQFNRYLTGESLPSERNLEKISSYFGVEEHDLFKENHVAAIPQPPADLNGLQADFRTALRLMHSETRPSLPAQIYFAYFTVPGDQKNIIRSTLVVKNDGNLATFRRLTGLAERKGSWWSQFYGDHKGIILERAHWLYLMGLNARGNREPSLVAVRWLPGSRPMLGGQAFVMSPLGPTAAAVVIDPSKPGTRLRKAFRTSHVYSIDDVSIDPIVIDALEDQARSLADASWRKGPSARAVRPPAGKKPRQSLRPRTGA